MTIQTVPAEVQMTPADKRQLATLEKRIERGLSTFREVGEALMEVRDRQLFRLTHATFEVYCRERWQLDRGRAYQLIGAAEVAQALPSNGKKRLVNEAQARELAPLLRADPETFKVVWQKVEADPAPLTASAIRDAVRTVTGEVVERRPPPTTTTALVALIERCEKEVVKWRDSKPNIGERRLVKTAMERLHAQTPR